MSGLLVLDTGPLVALLNARDSHHAWAREALEVRARAVTVEAVITEACHLLRTSRPAVRALLAMLEDGDLTLISMTAETPAVGRLMRRYESVPMSFADGCLVRLTELQPRCDLATIDSDFVVYRRNGRQSIPLIAPFS